MISADTAQRVIQRLGITSGDAATLLGLAIASGSASGHYDGLIISAHHAGDRKFTVEVS